MEQVLEDLTPKSRAYVQNRLSGMNKMQAAQAAGYSENSARCAKNSVEKPAVMIALKTLLREQIDIELLVTRLREGLEAMRTLSSGEAVVDFRERRETVKLVAQLLGELEPEPVAAEPITFVVDL